MANTPRITLSSFLTGEGGVRCRKHGDAVDDGNALHMILHAQLAKKPRRDWNGWQTVFGTTWPPERLPPRSFDMSLNLAISYF